MRNLAQGLRNISVLGRTIFLCLTLILTACSETSSVFYAATAQLDISGEASMFKAEAASSLDACSSAQATLHEISDTGVIATAALANTAIDSSGRFVFKKTQLVDVKLTGSKIKYVIMASGCDDIYYRPVTKHRDQNITSVSTLITLATNNAQDSSRRSLSSLTIQEVETGLASLVPAATTNSLITTLDTIIADTALTAKFQSLTSIPPEKVKETPPTLTISKSNSVTEASSTTFAVTTHHFNPQYQVAYEWIVNNAVVSKQNSFAFTTGKNSQGKQFITLKVGLKNASGELDNTKDIKTELIPVTITDDYPAVAPNITLAGSATLSSRNLSVQVNTGPALSHCETFTSFALVEGPGAPSSFPHTCTTTNLQNVAVTLTSPGDGEKILSIYVKDAQDNISEAKTLTVNLDTTAPIVSLVSAPAPINNLTSHSFSFSATDQSGINSYECRLDAGAFTGCSSPESYSGITAGAHTFYVRAIDNAGNVSNVASSSWTTDLIAPTISLTSTPNAISNQLSVTFSFSATDSGGGTLSHFLCKYDSGSYSVCLSPATSILAAGAHTFFVKAADSAGNISAATQFSFTIDTTAPAVTIGSKPSSLTNSTSANFTFSGTDTGGGTVASYSCSLDGASFSACSSPVSHNGLAAGGHSFQIRATDTAGNVGTAVSYSWTIDLSTPIANISSGPDSITRMTSASFTFSANPPPSGSITGYQCQLNGGGFSPCSSPINYSSLVQGDHIFQVRSVDNNNALSSISQYNWTVDLTNPTINFVDVPASINNITSTSLSFTSADSGGGTIASHECQLDAEAFTLCSSPVSLTTLSAGAHTFRVRAVDTAGNVSTTLTTHWTTDLQNPTVTLTAQPASLTNVSTGNFTFIGADTGGGSVTSYECSLDGAAYSLCSSPLSHSSLGQGAHVFSVRATDSAGNTGNATTYNWTIDLTKPVTTMTGGPSNGSYHNDTTPTFTFSATDSGGGAILNYSCSLDGASYTGCSSPHTLSTLAAGAHTLAIRATDTAGNVGNAVSVSWTLDTTPPPLTLATPAGDAFVVPANQVSNFTFSGACETGRPIVLTGLTTETIGCSGSAWSYSADLSAKAEGSLTLTATQEDDAGNTTTVNRTVIKDTTAPVIALTAVPTTPRKGNSVTNIQFRVTESNITTAKNFTVSYSTNNGSSWTAAGTVTSLNGPLTNQSFSYSLTLPAANSAQVRVKVEGSDTAGNIATPALSSAFTVDSAAPTLASVTIGDGSSVAVSPTLNIYIDADDALTGVASILIADAQGSNCQSSYNASGQWQSFTQGGGSQMFSYTTGFSNGLKKICVWAKDIAGNVSEITANANGGTIGVDTNTVSLDQGSPPTFTSLSVTNANSSSPNFGTTTFASGDLIDITFTVTDDSALAQYPVSVWMTTDNTEFTEVISRTTMGSPGVNQTSWTKTYSSYASTSSSYFRLRLIATDANGNTAQTKSAALNTLKWSLYAGNDDIGDGSSALSSLLRVASGDGAHDRAVVNAKNEIFIATRDGIRKISPTTGNIETYLRGGTETGVPGTITPSTRTSTINNVIMDGNILYANATNRLYRIDTITNTISIYAGGGSSPAINSTDPANAYIWASGAMTIDPVTKDLYYLTTCDLAGTGGSNVTYSIKIRKIIQNTTNRALAQSVQDFAGNCVKSSDVIDGTDALSSPLESAQHRHAHGQIVFVPETQALYYNVYGNRPLKIINGKIFRSPLAPEVSMRGQVYIAAQNRVYTSKPGTGVHYFTPNANEAFDEVFTPYIPDETQCVTDTCRNEGTAISSAGVYTGSLFAINGQLGIVDNTTNTSTSARLRVVDATTNSLQTLAGTDRFQGDGFDRALARFGAINRLIEKPTGDTNFPAGIYIGDSGGLRLLQVPLNSNLIHIRAGTGVSKGVNTTPLFGESFSLGTAFTNLVLNPAGLFTFYVSNRIYNVKADLTAEMYITNSGTNVFNRSEGIISNVASYTSNEHKHGMVYDANGNLYFGGYYSSGTGYNKIMVRRSNGAFYSVIGTTTNAVSADCTTPGCAKNQTMESSSSTETAGGNILGPYDDRYNNNEGRLLVAEKNTIRTIVRAYDNSLSTLGTLKTEAGANIALGRSIGAFTYNYVGSTSQIDKIYYLSGDSKLYCYKVSNGTDANCNNTAVSTPSAIGNFYEGTILWGSDGSIYVVGSSQNIIWKYTP